MSMLSRLAPLALVAATACAVDVDPALPDTDTTDHKMITWNALAWDAITWNTLTTSSIASVVLTDEPLSTDTYSAAGTSTRALLLRDHATPAPAQIFMEYLVGCALPKGSVVKWESTSGSQHAEYHGSLGLCPDWEYGRPDTYCRQRVSACLLARNNGLGETVRISLRGQDSVGDALPLAKSSWAFSDAPSPTELCPPGEPGCGFVQSPVGRCNPGDTVEVGAYHDPLRLRACSNDKACTLGESLDRADDGSSVVFTCPHTGVYNVMVGELWGPPSSWDLKSSAGMLPEDEGVVYRWREGAFFGDIFDYTALGVDTKLILKGDQARVLYLVEGKEYRSPDAIPAEQRYVVHRNMFSCQSDSWNDGDARAQFRVCAGIGSVHCAAEFAGNCSPWPASLPFPGAPFTTGGRCSIDDDAPVSGDRDYNDCEDLYGIPHKVVLTTSLKDKCDAIPGDKRKQCKKG
jgi:hypothetical protein